MTMGILGTSPTYTVPAGKVAVVNIFGTQDGISAWGLLKINGILVTQVYNISSINTAMEPNFQLKGIILSAGDVVTFTSCTGIVTGYLEDA